MTSQSDSDTGSSVLTPEDGWVRGSYTMRESGSTSDGVNGTIVTGTEMRKQAGVAPGEEVEIHVQHGGDAETTVREFHETGNTITVPLDVRQALSLSAGDEIEFWIRGHDGDETQTELREPGSHSQPADGADENSLYYLVTDTDPMRYHLATSATPDETACGMRLDGGEFRVDDEEPSGELLDKCLDCLLESDRAVRKDELVRWLGQEVGFEPEGGSSANLNKSQVRETVEYIRSLQGGDG